MRKSRRVHGLGGARGQLTSSMLVFAVAKRLVVWRCAGAAPGENPYDVNSDDPRYFTHNALVGDCSKPSWKS